MITLKVLLQIAGLLHLGLLCAGLLMPGVVQLRQHLAVLPAFIRRLYWVYYTFIALCLVGFGSLTFACAEALAGGSMLARGLCVFLALFWTVRLWVAAFVFDMSPYLTNGARRVGYHAINLVFVYLPLVYVWAAWKGGGGTP